MTKTPEPMSAHDKMRLRAAAFRAKKIYTPGVAELLSREFLNWEEFGYRFGPGSPVWMAVDEVLKAPDVVADIPMGVVNPAGKSAVGYG